MEVQTLDPLILMSSGVRFQPGRPLPPPEALIESLNELDVALQERKKEYALYLESKIKALVSRGVYQGYLKEVELKTTIVEVLSVERRGKGANLHTFVVKFQILRQNKPGRATVVAKTITMELIKFLTPINRTQRPEGGQVVGPRFWPH